MNSQVTYKVSSGLRWLWIAVLVLGLDRFSKMWVTSHLHYLDPLPITPFFNLTLVYNTGAAFSMFHSDAGWQNVLFIALATLISIAIFIWLARLPSRERWLSIALSLVLGGAIGNAWDRLLYGFVIDFLDFHWNDWHFAIFNVADAGICVGAAMMMFYWTFAKRLS